MVVSILDNYLLMLNDLSIASLKQWLAMFNRLSKKDKADLLKTYRIVPEQHQLKYVQQAVQKLDEIMRSLPPQKEASKDGRESSKRAEIDEANRVIASYMVDEIDRRIAVTTDPTKLEQLRKRRAKFAALLPVHDSLSVATP